MPRTAASVLLLVAPGTVPAADAQSRVGVVTTLQGPATVVRVRVPEPAPLKFRDDIFLYDRVATGDNGFARILLGGKALVTVRERSTLHITEAPGTSTVELGAGNIAVAVVKEKMKSEESVEIRTPNAVAAIRGTVVIAEHRRDASSFTVIRGIVDVMRLDPVTRQVVGSPVRVNPLQRIEIRATGALQPQPVSQEVLRRISGEFKISLDDQTNAGNAAPASPPPQPSGGSQGVGTSDGGSAGAGAGSGGAGGASGVGTSGASPGTGSGGSGSGSGPKPTTPSLPSTSAGPGSGLSSGGGSSSGPDRGGGVKQPALPSPPLPVPSGRGDGGGRGGGRSGGGGRGQN